jgi:RHS repeat-associated protein
VYGEDYAGGRAAAAEQNLLTRAWKQYDSAGVVTNETCDFKGNPLRSSRRLVRDYKTVPDWDTFPEPEDRPDAWEEEIFQSSTRYDALNRPIQLVAPHAGSETDVIQPGYNEANLLERLDVWLKHTGEPAELLTPDTADEHFVTNIDYNARGQRTLIQYGNNAETRYHYDPATFRLTHLYTRRDISYNEDCGDEPSRYPAPDMSPQDTPCGLQNLHYTYDPAGNITAIRDDSQHTIYFNGQVVRPDTKYTYDALYRLIEACGREHIGQASEPQSTWHDSNRINLAHPNDGQAMRNYFEFYEYDEVGNILKFDHKADRGNWTRAYEYDVPNLIELEKNSNRLSCTVVHPNGNHPISEPYTHDLHGNMTSMPHLPEMAWDFKDQLHMVDKGGGCMAYYVYDAGGQRVRKVIEQNGMRQKERFYIGGFEVYRKYNGDGSTITLERETLHVMDDQQRIALVEARTQGEDDSLPQLIRYQFGNHLGSASLELDHQAQIISYEEYYPYGSTSYQAVRSQTETPKRYRYTGMERDEETGLNYHTARYYAPWLRGWISTDPAGLVDGVNLYRYSRNNPIRFIDPIGKWPPDTPDERDPEVILSQDDPSLYDASLRQPIEMDPEVESAHFFGEPVPEYEMPAEVITVRTRRQVRLSEGERAELRRDSRIAAVAAGFIELPVFVFSLGTFSPTEEVGERYGDILASQSPLEGEEELVAGEVGLISMGTGMITSLAASAASQGTRVIRNLRRLTPPPSSRPPPPPSSRPPPPPPSRPPPPPPGSTPPPEGKRIFNIHDVPRTNRWLADQRRPQQTAIVPHTPADTALSLGIRVQESGLYQALQYVEQPIDFLYAAPVWVASHVVARILKWFE